MSDRAAVTAALEAIPDPKTGQGLVTAGRVKGLIVVLRRAGFALEATPEERAQYLPVRDAAEAALKALPGITQVSVVLTTDVPAMPPRRRTAGLSREATDQGRARVAPPTDRPAHVRRVLAVASGKGGVGKSTVAVNLACAFAARGLRAGLLDVDVYGPSAPTMLGVSGKPAYEDGAMVPHQAWGLKINSVGLLTNAEDAMIWRGPMASQAVTQLLTQTRWGTEDEPLDILVVDLPPGTGDVQLTLMQKTPLDGAVIVSTPQEVALADARRAKTLFDRINVPTLGMIENMAGFPDPAGGALIPIFGRGGARDEAERMGVPFLGELPLNIALREGGDEGRPLTATRPDGDIARRFGEMAERLAASLDDKVGSETHTNS